MEYAKAMPLYLAAAEKSNTEAMPAVGQFYAKGLGVKQDAKQAIEW